MAWIQSRDKNDYSVNYPLVLNPNGGNVGIGTTSPSPDAKLHINSSLSTSLYITTTSTSSRPSLWLGNNYSSTPKWGGI